MSNCFFTSSSFILERSISRFKASSRSSSGTGGLAPSMILRMALSVMLAAFIAMISLTEIIARSMAFDSRTALISLSLTPAFLSLMRSTGLTAKVTVGQKVKQHSRAMTGMYLLMFYLPCFELKSMRVRTANITSVFIDFLERYRKFVLI